MADRFCEPGLYGSAVVIANTTSGSATLTVTSVTSGRLGIGAFVTGPGIPADTIISSLGTGRGGAGTYTMNKNATATQTGITVNAVHGNPSLDPAWGVAQDGDGLAKGAATPATAHIVFTAAPTTGSISVCGVTLSVTWGSSANSAADALASAINSSAGIVTTSSYNSGVQLRNAVFARGPSNGAPAGTCQIMTRVGSALHNGLICIAHTLDNVDDANSQLTFSGGASGAWGYLFNANGTAWPSGISAYSYGLWGNTQPFVGSQAGHTVHIRADVPEIYCTYGADVAITIASTVSPSTSVVTINKIDDGTHWASSEESALSIRAYTTGFYKFQIDFQNVRAFKLRGRRTASGNYTLKFYQQNTSSVSNGLYNINSDCEVVGLYWKNSPSVSSWPRITFTNASNNYGFRVRFIDCKFEAAATSGTITTFTETVHVHPFEMVNFEFSNAGGASAHTGIFTLGSTSNAATYVFKNVKFRNFVAGSKLFSDSLTSSAPVNIQFINCDFGNVTQRGPSLAVSNMFDYRQSISSFSQYGNRDFFIDYIRGFIEWNSLLSQPTLNAVLPDGVTKWSIKVLPRSDGNTNLSDPLEVPRFAKINTLPTGQRTITVQFCASDQLTWTKKHVSIQVMYRAANGELVILDTYDENGGALDASNVTWSQESNGKVTFVAGSTVYHDKYKLSVTTPPGMDLPNGEEVNVLFRVHRSVTNNTQFVFVDPDITIE